MSQNILTWYHSNNLLDRYQFGMLKVLLEVDRKALFNVIILIDKIIKGQFKYSKYYKKVHTTLFEISTDPFAINTQLYCAVITRNSSGLKKDDRIYLEKVFKKVKNYFNKYYYPDKFVEMTIY